MNDPTPDGIAILDAAGYVEKAYEDFCGYLGGSPGDWRGRHVTDVLPASRALTTFLDAPESVGVWMHTGILTGLGTEWRGSAWLYRIAENDDPEDPSHFFTLVASPPDRSIGHRLPDEPDLDLSLTVEQLRVGLIIVGPDRRPLAINNAACEFFGRSREDLRGVDASRLVHPDELMQSMTDYCRLLSGRVDGWDHQRRYVRPDGEVVWARETVGSVWGPDGGLRNYIWHLIDITEQKQIELDLRDRERRLDFLTTTLPTAVLEVDASGVIMTGNPAAEELIGRSSLTGVDTGDVIHNDDWEMVGREALVAIDERDDWGTDFRLASGTAATTWVRATNRAHFDADGSVSSITSTWADITASRRHADHLTRRAMTDPLTGLLNRAALDERLEELGDESAAVLFVDLDGFKTVNDEQGHARGDEVLSEVAKRLQAAAREHDTVARYGGDEFVVLARGIGQIDRAERIGERIVAEVGAPYAALGDSIRIGASVGIAATGPASDPIAALHLADRLAYAAKADGGGRVATESTDTLDPDVNP